MAKFSFFISTLFFVASVEAASHASGVQGRCSNLLPSPLQGAQAELTEAGRWQEAFWRMHQNGDKEGAERLEKHLTQILQGEVLGREAIKIGAVYRLKFAENVYGIFKPLVTPSFTNKAEERAYRLDKSFGHIFHVPLTIYRQIGEEWGSVQLEVPFTTIKKQNPMPEAVMLFDLLIGNMDRFPYHNLLYTLDDNFVAIDNAQAIYLMGAGVTAHPHHELLRIWIKNRCGSGLEGEQADQLRQCFELQSMNLEKIRALMAPLDSNVIRHLFEGDLGDLYIQQILENLKLLKQI